MRTAIKYFDFEKYFFPEKIFLVAETKARLLSKSGNDWERVSEYLYYRGKSNQIVVGSRIYQSQVLEKKLAVADSSQVDRRHRCGLCRPGAGDGVHTVQPQSGLQAINQSQVVIRDKYDWSKWTQMKWMQPRAKVQHLPVLADGQAAGFCGQSQGGGEKDTEAREICLNFKEN